MGDIRIAISEILYGKCKFKILCWWNFDIGIRGVTRKSEADLPLAAFLQLSSAPHNIMIPVSRINLLR